MIDVLEADGSGVSALLICPIFANEVQAGYGRIGRWWGYGVGEIRPPLAFTKKHASSFLTALEQTIGEMYG